jgi:hypothetical protein
MSKFTLRAAAAALAGILIAIGGCAESPSAPAVPDASDLTFLRTPLGPSLSRGGSSSVVIDQGGGMLQTADGHKLVFPAGSVSQPTQITMTTVNGYVGVDLQPHGLVFPVGKEPVLTLDYSNASVVRSTGDLFVVYIDEDGAVAEVLATRVLGLDAKVRTNLRHFSRYIAAGN